MISDEILCIGEILWDSLPAGLFLGGAPLNVAGHLRALGVPAAIVSRVGSDRLGDEAVRRAEQLGVATELIQVDAELPTGFVTVALDGAASATFDIVAPAAWDAIELTGPIRERAARARALVFGSLAQRSPGSRATIRALRSLPITRVFDVNLRPPWEEAEVVRESLESADLVKLNEAELHILIGWFDLPRALPDAARGLADRFGCTAVCITRAEAGAAMLHQDRWTEHPGYRVAVADTVGSGDAFLAAFLQAYLEGAPDVEVLRRANLLGAYVAGRPGAIPPHDSEALQNITEQDRGLASAGS